MYSLTETTFTDGEFGTIYRAMRYNEGCGSCTDAGNDLVAEVDARGAVTAYDVNAETSRNEEVTDRCGSKTVYEYDASGRTTKVTSKQADGAEIASVTYAYDAFDNLTAITRGDGLAYSLAYNEFHNLQSIGLSAPEGSEPPAPLVAYTYKNGNGRLKKIAYANGHVMKAFYNSAGQMAAEKWFADAACTVPVAHYKYVYDGQGNIVRSIDVTARKEYTYTYENGKITRAAESDITIGSNEVITSRTLVQSILYVYDKDDKLVKKRILPVSGDEQTYYYENPENENAVVKFTAGGRTVTSHSKNDSFGRKVFDELQLTTGFVSRQFLYHTGSVTPEHHANGKLKSSPTTQLVKSITFADDRMLSYEYDAEERITKVTDSIDGITEYTYDAQRAGPAHQRNPQRRNCQFHDL